MKRALLLLVLLSIYSLMPVKASGADRAGELRPMKIIMTINHQSYEIALADNPTAESNFTATSADHDDGGAERQREVCRPACCP